MNKNDILFPVNQNAVNFLMYSYFGILPKDLNELEPKEIALKCAHTAYLDLNRTLRFSTKNEDKHKNFSDEICELIVNEIFKLFEKSEESFDDSHANICKAIINKAKDFENKESILLEIENKHGGENSKFYYGQAQKWLNMTIKYMWLLGLWDEQFKELLFDLHVPVDSFIIEAVWNKTSIDLPLVNKNSNRSLTFSTDKVIPWSKWTEKDYKEFQGSLRISGIFDNNSPIEWEGTAWIGIAKERSNK